eukprot:m.2815 g.2815  ORF g.2815 m.2815 type:complete len:54 (-) comp2765_c0_seq1:25-186(-)
MLLRFKEDLKHLKGNLGIHLNKLFVFIPSFCSVFDFVFVAFLSIQPAIEDSLL